MRVFCWISAKIPCHGNRGRSDVNFDTTIRFSDHNFHFLKLGDIFVTRTRFVWFWTILLRGPLQNRKSLPRRINNLFLVSSKKYTITYSHAIKLVPKYGEVWMKNVLFRREILKMAHKTWNWLLRMHAKYFYLTVTNKLALENYFSYPCTKLVKIGEKLRLLAFMKERISLHWKSVAMHAHCINPCWL